MSVRQAVLRFRYVPVLVVLLGCTSVSVAGPLFFPGSAKPVARAQADLPPEQVAEACLATAEALDKSGHEQEAILQYEKARQNNPHLTQLARRLAVLYDRQGNEARAQAEYRQALVLAPRDVDLLNDYGYFLYGRGDLGAAEQCLRHATSLNPGYQRAWVNLGLVLGGQRRFPESYAAFARAVSRAEAYSNVGILQAQQGQYLQARQSLRQALALDPHLQPAQVVLARLERPGAVAAQPPAQPLKQPADSGTTPTAVLAGLHMPE